MPSIDPVWLAKEVLRRMDDKMDLTAAIVAGVPSIVSQNQQAASAMTMGGDPAAAPDAQGGEGAMNAPQPPGGEGGSGPSFGSNQVPNPF